MTVSFLCWVHSHTGSYPPPPSPPLPDPYRLTHHVGLLLSQLLVTDHTPDNLRVEGAFLVSGCYHQNATSFVSVLSEAGQPCRVELPSLRLPLAVLLSPGSEAI